MVHAANRGVTQDFYSSDVFECGWTKNVIDAAIVDCGIAGSAAQIAKVAQDMAVRFAIVFQVVSIKIRFVGRFEFEVKITGNENLGRSRSSLGPINQCLRVSPTASGIERISVGAQN